MPTNPPYSYVARCRRCLAYVTATPDDPGALEPLAEAVAAMVLAGLIVTRLPREEAEYLRRAHPGHDAGCPESPQAIADRYHALHPPGSYAPCNTTLLGEVLELRGGELTASTELIDALETETTSLPRPLAPSLPEPR